MIQDYLDAKEQENFFKEITARKKVGSKITIRKSTISVNSLLKEKQKSFEPMEKDLKELNQTSSVIGNSIKGIADSYKLLAVAVLAAGAALFGAVKYLESLSDGSGFAGSLFGGGADYKGSGMSTGRMSDQGVHDLLQYEGFDEVAVDREGDGILTIGHGHKGKDVKPGQRITREEAFKLFKQDLKPREDYVAKMVKVPITQNMFDALVSFEYNCGSGNFAKSKTLKLLNQGDYKGAAEAMKTEYINKGTKHEKGLRARRAKEAAKLLIDVTEDNKIANPYTADNKNKTAGSAKVANIVSAAKAGAKYDYKTAQAKGLTGKCAKAVCDYLQKAGVNVSRQASAYMLADVLAKHPNFMEVDPSYPKLGDVVINGRSKQAEHGHIFISDGTTENYRGMRVPNSGWSDFAGRQVNLDSYSGIRVFRYIEKGQDSKTPTTSKPPNDVNQGNQTKPREIPKQSSKPQSTPTQKPSTTPPAKNVNPPSTSTNTQETVNLNKPKLNNTTSKKK